jgi:hypothetical protein
MQHEYDRGLTTKLLRYDLIASLAAHSDLLPSEEYRNLLDWHDWHTTSNNQARYVQSVRIMYNSRDMRLGEHRRQGDISGYLHFEVADLASRAAYV